jgi:PPM family protein phosphatase
MSDEETLRLPARDAVLQPRRLRAHAVSECGPYRKGNEDAFGYDVDAGLFVVADGMGGHAAGEIASRLAVESILAFMARSIDDDEPSWPFEFDESLSLHANRLRTAVHLANRRVFRAGESEPDYTGMGSTVVAVCFTAASYVVAHAGDSRVYEYVAAQLTRLTKDDSLIDEAGGLAAGDPPPPRNIVTNVLGADETIKVHMLERPRAAGTLLLLCSDGVHGALDAARIGDILAGEIGPQQQAARLVAEAIAAGGRDNATALVVVDSEGL